MTVTAPTRSAEISDADREYVRGLFPELAEMRDQEMAAKVVDIWVETWKESGWGRIEAVPKNPETVHLRHDLVAHTRAVTVQGIAMARATEQFHGIPVDMDLVIAGCNLHDVSKLMEFEPGGGESGPKSRFGELVLHGTYGVHKVLAHGLPVELSHIISSHTTQSRMVPKTVEAVIVHYADYADSDTLMLEAGRKLLLTAAR